MKTIRIHTNNEESQTNAQPKIYHKLRANNVLCKDCVGTILESIESYNCYFVMEYWNMNI
jgi:hypothetical protein